MNNLGQAFPEFIQSCVRMHSALLPFALCLFVVGFCVEFLSKTPTVPGTLRFLVKIIIILLITSHSHHWINTGQVAIDQFLKENVPARSENVASHFKNRVSEVLGNQTIQGQSVWDILVSGQFLDGILYAMLLLVSYAVVGIIAFISSIQKLALFTCWAICPILFPLMSIPALYQIGMAHLMRVVAVMCWPIGFAVAAIFTEALIELSLNDRLLAQGSYVGTLATMIESLLVISVVGVWMIVSSIMAPILVHRVLVGNGWLANLPLESATLLAPAATSVASYTVSKTVELYRRSDTESGPDFTIPPAETSHVDVDNTEVEEQSGDISTDSEPPNRTQS